MSGVTLPDLPHFHCSEQVYFNPMFKSVYYTEGVKYVSDNGAAWLVTDILAHLIHNPKLQNVEFASIDATGNGHSAKLQITYENVTGEEVIEEQEYGLSDLNTKVGFFYIDGMLILKSEY